MTISPGMLKENKRLFIKSSLFISKILKTIRYQPLTKIIILYTCFKVIKYMDTEIKENYVKLN